MFNQQAALFHMEMCCHVFIHPAKSSSEPLSKTWSEFPLRQIIKTGNLFCNRKPASDILSVVNLKSYKENYKKVTKVATITGVQFCFELTNWKKQYFLWERFSLSRIFPYSKSVHQVAHLHEWLICVHIKYWTGELPRDPWRGGAGGPAASWLYWAETGSEGCLLVYNGKLWRDMRGGGGGVKVNMCSQCQRHTLPWVVSENATKESTMAYSGLQLTFCRSCGRHGVGAGMAVGGSRFLSCNRLTTLRASGVLDWRLMAARDGLSWAGPGPTGG